MKKVRLSVLLLALLLTFSGCGIRSRVLPGQDALANGGQGIPAAGTEEAAMPEEGAAGTDAGAPDPNAPTRNDPEAQRREYAEGVSASLTEKAEIPVRAAGEDAPPFIPSEAEPSGREAIERPEADLTVTQTVSQEEAARLGVSEEAPEADSALQYYQTLLHSRLDALFECKRLYVYWETPEACRTIYKTSPEHAVILLAGGYDVSAKRPEDALLVDDGWIGRKNPGCIVKCVDGDVLGAGVEISGAARGAYEALLSREGWESLAAVREEKVLLLSQELLDTPAGQTAAALYLARVMYPAEMEDVDPDAARRQLLREESGAETAGIFAYPLP